MSSANEVPETVDLGGEEAWFTLRTQSAWSMVRTTSERLRFADGFSHARALAFQTVLALLPGVVVVVALTVILSRGLGDSIRQTINSLAPGPAGELFRDAFRQGEAQGSSGSGGTALVVGGTAMISAGAAAFGQIERAANRLYGIEVDRRPAAKYGRALLLTLTAGALSVAYFVVIGAGRSIAHSLGEDSTGRAVLLTLRWPVGVAALAAAVALVMRLCPNRRQPHFSWLAVGSLVAVAACLTVSLILHMYLDMSDSFGDTYGPIAGIIGLMLWTYASALAVLFGIAFSAQLEAVRAGRAAPRDEAREEHTDSQPGRRSRLPAERAADCVQRAT